MGTTSAVIDEEVDDLISKMYTATTLGSFATVLERDEHPAVAAERGQLPIAYVLPILEDGDKIDMTMGGPQTFHTFSMTAVAYYRGEDTTLLADLRTTRGYAYNFVDIFLAGNYLKRAQIYSAKVDVGYWIGGTFPIHYWICKLSVKLAV